MGAAGGGPLCVCFFSLLELTFIHFRLPACRLHYTAAKHCQNMNECKRKKKITRFFSPDFPMVMDEAKIYCTPLQSNVTAAV